MARAGKLKGKEKKKKLIQVKEDCHNVAIVIATSVENVP
jgi:hypothetical protein